MEPGQERQFKSKSDSKDQESLRAYGKLPRAGGLLRPQSMERKYFDSGDFALSAADRETDAGVIHTGKSHPLRENISHPYAPVPGSGNVDQNANKKIHDQNNPSQQVTESPLHQQADIDDSMAEKLEGQT